MTLDNVEAAERALVNTTTGAPGTVTRETAERTAATHSVRYGYGIAEPERVITGQETTIAGRRVAQATLLGLGLAIGGAAIRDRLE